MFDLVAIAAVAFSFAGADDVWRCRNQYEVWCAETGCRLAPKEETTPLDISADRQGFSVCAYSGCWEGKARPKGKAGRQLWTAENVSFSTSKEGMKTDVTLLIFEADGVGFVRAGGLATPLLCERRAKTGE
jgi:hypothetical protein